MAEYRSTRAGSTSPGSRPAGQRPRSWQRPIPTSTPRSACTPVSPWRRQGHAVGLRRHAAGARRPGRGARGAERCRRSCSTATRTGRSTRATATRSSPRRRPRAACRPRRVAQGGPPGGTALPPHDPCRRGRSGDARALGDPGRRPCLGRGQPGRLLHRPARAGRRARCSASSWPTRARPARPATDEPYRPPTKATLPQRFQEHPFYDPLKWSQVQVGHAGRSTASGRRARAAGTQNRLVIMVF